MPGINVELVGLDDVRSLIDELPEHTFDVARAAISDAVLNTHAKVSSFSGGLHSRSGVLKRSLKTELNGTRLNELRGDVYTDVKYAPIHEKGGTVRAIGKYVRVPGGPYLNIPLSANKTAAGVMRMNARQVFSAGGYIIRSRAGNYLVMSGTGQPMFVLKKQVTIPARLGMVKAAEDEIPTLLSTLSNELLRGL